MIQQSIRNGTNSARRRMLGIFVIAWLNLAVMPCAMAFEVAADCPQFSPVVEQEMAHHGHHEAEPMPDCLSMPSDCCDLEAAAVDKRSGKFDGQYDLPAMSTASAWSSLQKVRVPRHATRPPDPGNYSPPLHVLHCVYLD